MYAVAADRLFDGEKVLTNRAVLVDKGVVTSVLASDKVPTSVPLFRETDTTILPGLIDAHVHFMQWEAPLYLAHGVTTIRDVGNELAWILKQGSEADARPSPSILCVGPLVEGPHACHPLVARVCSSEADAISAVRDLAYVGVDGIKLYVGMPATWLTGIVREAHAMGLKVCMHTSGIGVRPAIKASVDEFFHLDGVMTDVWPDHPGGWLNLWGNPDFAATIDEQKRLADEIAAAGMTATPTLAYWDSQCFLRDSGFSPDKDTPHVPADMVRWQRKMSGNVDAVSEWRRALDAARRFTGLLLERGVRVLAGTDVPCGAVPAGRSLWREMALLVESGMTVLQALQSATSCAADFLGHPELGRIRSGMPANLSVVRGNPTTQIPAEPQIVTVLRNGKQFRPDELIRSALPLASSVTTDPWGRQFRMHVGGK